MALAMALDRSRGLKLLEMVPFIRASGRERRVRDEARDVTMGAAIKLMEDGMLEARGQTRRTVRANAYLCIDLCSEHNFWTGLTMNLSEGGVFVATHVMLPVGTLVGLHLELPSHRIMALGEVKWSRAYTGNDDVPPGIGIQFVGLDEPSQREIRNFVTRIREPLLFES